MEEVLRHPVASLLARLTDVMSTVSAGCALPDAEGKVEQWCKLEPLLKIVLSTDAINLAKERLKADQGLRLTQSDFFRGNYTRCAVVSLLRFVLESEKLYLRHELIDMICQFSLFHIDELLEKDTSDAISKIGERGLVDLDLFLFYLVPLLVTTAQTFPDATAQIMNLLAALSEKAMATLRCEQDMAKYSATKAFVLIHGVVYGLGRFGFNHTLANALSDKFAAELLSVITDSKIVAIIRNVKLQISERQSAQDQHSRLPVIHPRPWLFISLCTLYESVFVLGCRFAQAFLVPLLHFERNGTLSNGAADAEQVWDALVESNLPLIPHYELPHFGDNKVWASFARLCWSAGWKRNVRELLSDSADSRETDPLAFLLPAVCRCGALASIMAGATETKLALQIMCAYLKPERELWTGTDRLQTDIAVLSLEFCAVASLWNPSNALNMSDWLKWYLIAPPTFLETASVELVNVLRQCASRMLTLCLQASKNKVALKQTVKFMAVKAQTSRSESRLVYENGVAAICGIASSENVELEICQHVVSGLIARAEWRSFDVFLIDRLVDLVLTLQFDEPRLEIMEFLVKLYCSPSEAEQEWLKMHLASRFQFVATSFGSSKVLKDVFFLEFFKQVLDLVVFEAVSLLNADSGDRIRLKFTAFELRHITHLLAVLQLLCEQPVAFFTQVFAFAAKSFPTVYFPQESPFVWDSVPSSNRQLVAAVSLGIRDMWLILPLLGLNSKTTQWTVPEWTLFLNSIARRTPALTMVPNAQKLDVDLQSHSCLSKRLCELFSRSACRVLSVKARIDSALLQNANSVSPILPIYFLAQLCVESFRIVSQDEPLPVAPLLNYVTDERTYGQPFYPLQLKLAEFLLDMAAASWRENGSAYATANMQLLVAHTGFRLPDVRAWCIKQSERMFSVFPHFYFEKKLVYLALDMLQWLTRVGVGVLPLESLLHGRVAPLLQIWQNVTDEPLRAEQIELFLRHFMDAAAVESAIETMNIVQCYLLDLSLHKPTHFAQQTTFMGLMSHLCGQPDRVKYLFESYNEENRFIGEVVALLGSVPTRMQIYAMCVSIKHELLPFLDSPLLLDTDCIPLLYRGAALLFVQPEIDTELVHLLVRVPIRLFSSAVIEVAVDVWQWLISTHASLEAPILSDLIGGWCESMSRRVGIYAPAKGKINPFYKKMTYTPSERPVVAAFEEGRPHLFLLQFAADRLNVLSKKCDAMLNNATLLMFSELANAALRSPEQFNPGAQCRETLFTLFLFGMQVLEVLVEQSHVTSGVLRYWIYRGALSWFEYGSEWAETGRVDEIKVLQQFRAAVIADLSSPGAEIDSKELGSGGVGNSYLKIMTGEDFTHAQTLILHLLENELSRLIAWHDPLGQKFADRPDEYKVLSRTVAWEKLLPTAFKIAPRLTVEIARRAPELDSVLVKSFQNHFWIDLLPVLECPPALNYLLDKNSVRLDNYELRFLLYWCPTTPVTGIAMLTPDQSPHPWILQYALRVLDHYPAEQVFFYVPQLVQALRYDRFGYIERYILETAHSSALFAHQIIWNMNANMFRDEDAQIPDVLKPVLDRVINRIIGSLSGSDRTFYEREFEFFRQVTSISGKLKPYIRKSKPEKKKKIDEEMQNVQVLPGVYLPTNPESIVVDIDKNSGKPLQSHAKAPFMATFKIQQASEDSSTRQSLLDGSAAPKSSDGDDLVSERAPTPKAGDTPDSNPGQWMSAIFKVGDDCRQDILALQLISMFKAVFKEVKLDMYVYPYRIVATAPGCGVIEVIPESTSRDMIGREKINNLFDYYVQEFGTVHSIAFQEARDNLVRSLAAYSVISYILQIKDRHNGNIMFDSQGHILHIDFGFLLDISPGGINFESSPFKLTTEMIQVLGGDVKSFWYRRFCQLVIQGYLAVRPYMQEFVQIVQLMVDSGLPCFKGESTLRKLRKRFLPGESEKAAARFMYARIKEAHENKRTELYDEFQRFQNGIPY